MTLAFILELTVTKTTVRDLNGEHMAVVLGPTRTFLVQNAGTISSAGSDAIDLAGDVCSAIHVPVC